MNLGLSEEQRLLRDSVERLVADTSSIEERRRIGSEVAVDPGALAHRRSPSTRRDFRTKKFATAPRDAQS